MISWLKPIPQDQSYHQFADSGVWLGTPNGANVWSSFLFVVVGLTGLFWLVRRAVPQRWLWMTFYGAVTLVGFGSAYYHLNPTDATLFWDRLPMALAFMSFFAGVLADRCGERVGVWSFGPLVAFGIGSVIYWRYTGDLRWYGLVQYGPMLAIPLLLLVRPSRYMRTGDVWIAAACYAMAKGFEHFDAPLLKALGVSGHTLKHVAAAAGVGWTLRALWR